jgi:hypothetical protein
MHMNLQWKALLHLRRAPEAHGHAHRTSERSALYKSCPRVHIYGRPKRFAERKLRWDFCIDAEEKLHPEEELIRETISDASL